MSKKISVGIDIAASIFVCFVIFGYVCLRASLLSLTHDEAHTYLLYARNPVFDIFFNPVIASANNHLLNTLLIKLFTSYLGNSEFVIRIPALLGCAIYLWASYRIARLFLNGPRLVLGLILLTTNPLLIDFFSCARGYSLALGFSMLTFYHCMRRVYSTEKEVFSRNSLIVTAATLAMLSNLTFINVFLSTVSFLILWESWRVLGAGRPFWIQGLKRMVRELFSPLALSGLYLSIAYSQPILEAIRSNPSTMGGKIGFWEDVVNSLIATVFRNRVMAAPAIQYILCLFVIISCIIATLALIYAAWKKRLTREMLYLLFTAFSLFFVSMILKPERSLLHIDYPKDRAALYLIPLFFMLVLLLWKVLDSLLVLPLARVARKILYLFVSLAIAQHLLCVNVSYYYCWKYDAATKIAVAAIDNIAKQEHLFKKGYSLDIDWVFGPSVYYYITKRHMDNVKLSKFNNPDDPSYSISAANFYYALNADKAALKEYSLEVIKTFAISKTYLARSQPPPDNSLQKK